MFFSRHVRPKRRTKNCLLSLPLFTFGLHLRPVAKEMALFNPEVRRRTDALDAAGNTTAAIGKVPWFKSKELQESCGDSF